MDFNILSKSIPGSAMSSCGHPEQSFLGLAFQQFRLVQSTCARVKNSALFLSYLSAEVVWPGTSPPFHIKLCASSISVSKLSSAFIVSEASSLTRESRWRREQIWVLPQPRIRNASPSSRIPEDLLVSSRFKFVWSFLPFFVIVKEK